MCTAHVCVMCMLYDKRMPVLLYVIVLGYNELMARVLVKSFGWRMCMYRVRTHLKKSLKVLNFWDPLFKVLKSP